MNTMQTIDFDVAVVGGGPAGATAAQHLAQQGHRVLLLDRAGRIKPCGGAVPPQLLEDFDIPRSVLEAEIGSARMVSPTARHVDMPISEGFVGMVDRGSFDEWLRKRSVSAGAVRISGTFARLGESDGQTIELFYKPCRQASNCAQGSGSESRLRVRYVIGADGARSSVAEQAIPSAKNRQSVFAYHEIVELPDDAFTSADATTNATTNATTKIDGKRCDVIYDGRLSPDFYSWVFPHGKTVSIGTGTAVKGYSLRASVNTLREQLNLQTAQTVRTEGAPIPMKPLKRWDDGKHVLVCGDAAGVVAPASGEGIYYAMVCGQMAADAVHEALVSADPKLLRKARRRFMKKHGKVFFILGIMQRFWYHSDSRRERFVTLCKDPDIQRLTWESYLYKKLVRRDFKAHLRIFFKDLAHLLGLRSAVN